MKKNDIYPTYNGRERIKKYKEGGVVPSLGERPKKQTKKEKETAIKVALARRIASGISSGQDVYNEDVTDIIKAIDSGDKSVKREKIEENRDIFLELTRDKKRKKMLGKK